MKAKVICIQIIALALIVQFSILLINFVVDPYDLFNLVDIHRRKIVAINNLKLKHALHANLKRTETLFLGSSTVLSGYAPHYSIPNIPYVYNSGLPGANIYEIRCYLQHFVNTNTIKILFLNLDFFMFNANRALRPDFNINNLTLTNKQGIVWRKISQTLKFLSNIQTLIASKQVLFSQDDTDVELFSNGFLERSKKQVSEKGHRFLFDQELKSNEIETYHKFNFNNLTYSTFSQLEEILNIAVNHDIKVYVILSPIHKEHYSLLKKIHMISEYFFWKKKVKSLVYDANNKSLNSVNKIEFWDFSYMEGISEETVPTSNTNMEYFWDSMHFKYALGDKIIKEILKKSLPKN